MSKLETRSIKLEIFFKQHNLETCISFLREIFQFRYVKTRGDDGVYMWLGDRDWNNNSKCQIAHVGYCSFIFIDYTEDQIINKYTKYYKLKGFL